MSSIKPKEFRKKPVRIWAMQWDGSYVSAMKIAEWAEGDHDGGLNYWAPGAWDNESNAAYLTIDTLEGRMLAGSGDWIICGVKGEFYPCKPDIFAATYDEVAP